MTINLTSRNSITFTTLPNTKYIVAGFYAYGAGTDNNIITDFQLELGDSRTEYEPFKKLDTIPIDWTDNGTIYGGYVDLIKGKLVASYLGVKIPLSTASKYMTEDTRDGYVFSNIDFGGRILRNNKQKSNLARYQWETWKNGDVNHFYAYTNTNNNLCNIHLALQKNMDENTILEIYAEAETPIEYDIYPMTINSLIGQNNIWSTADTVEVEYYFLESLDIYKQRFKANEPHLESSIGNIANFTTDMISPLKGCKINFSPIQYGTGDPSPENVREIHGWTGINIWHGKENKIVFENPKTISGASGGVTWILNQNGSLSYEGTPTAFTGTTIGDYYVKGGEKIKLKITGDTYNLTSNSCNVFDINDNRIATIGDSALTTRWIDLSEYPDAYRIKIGIKRSLNNVYMHGTAYFDMDVDDVSSSTLSSISWETEYGEIYGGYINPLTGTGKIEWWHHAFTGEETFYDTRTWVTSYLSIDGYNANAQNPAVGICSHYPYGPYGRGKIGVMYNEKACIFDGNIYDAAGWKQYCADQYQNGTPVQVAYKLRDLIDFSLDPITLKSLRGINNIWTNSNGTTEVKYWTH